MFTKLNRVLLASGLAVASAAMLSPVAFAQTVDSDFRVLNGTLLSAFTLTWTGNPSPVAFTIQPTGTTTQALGTIAATGNVQYKITATTNSGTPGSLKGASGATIPYALKLDAATLPNTTSPFNVHTSGVTTDPLVATSLTLTIEGADTVGKLAEVYTDTLTLSTVANP